MSTSSINQQTYSHRIIRYFLGKNPSNRLTEVLSGITVALALIPEAVAFAFVAGVSPLISLQGAIVMGIVGALLTGRPGMISSSTAAIAVVMASLVAMHGLEYLFASVILMGVFQCVIGILRLGKYTSIIPHPVVLGFLNGLAILIFIAQLDQFKIKETVILDGLMTTVSSWLAMPDMLIMIGFVLLTMVIIVYFPKITKKVPSTLFALATVTVISYLLSTFDIYTLQTVQDFAGEAIRGSLPIFGIPMVPRTRETLQIILPYSIVAGLVGLTEATLTLRVLDDMTNTKGFMNQEYLAQGIGNLFNGFFGGMGGDAMVGQSIINIKSGARARLAGIIAALSLIIFLIFLSPVVNAIPLASLVGLMFVVVISTFEWETLKYYGKIPFEDILVIIVVTIVTIFSDLATAVIVGVIFSTLVFAWKKGKALSVKTITNKNGQKVYKINGLLFFGSTINFKKLFNIEHDPKEIVIDLKYAKVMDQSGLDALCSIVKKYQDVNKNVVITRPGENCQMLIERAQSISPIPLNLLLDPTDNYFQNNS